MGAAVGCGWGVLVGQGVFVAVGVRVGVEVGVGVKVAVGVGVKVAVGVGVSVGLFNAPAGIGADELRASAIQPGIAAHTARALPRITRVMISVATQLPVRFLGAGLAFVAFFFFSAVG